MGCFWSGRGLLPEGSKATCTKHQAHMRTSLRAQRAGRRGASDFLRSDAPETHTKWPETATTSRSRASKASQIGYRGALPVKKLTHGAVHMDNRTKGATRSTRPPRRSVTRESPQPRPRWLTTDDMVVHVGGPRSSDYSRLKDVREQSKLGDAPIIDTEMFEHALYTSRVDTD